jgi:hypothetical protein
MAEKLCFLFFFLSNSESVTMSGLVAMQFEARVSALEL